ncbi:hypothetical protein [Psychroflexus maritimus]|uniref:Membrane or secreted protein n=1 Tax=Psychroflexus maritimus TaxID=2714865 RepID=A0A967AGP7_9FLAO|nr:hypothetical protein [Psychroflexus maritimus]NGZ90166.1 hypothetical protein [Psychroflexus maritimus]
MKRVVLILSILFFNSFSYANNLNGAWKLDEVNGKKVETHVIQLFSDQFYTFSEYDKKTGDFVRAGGGTYLLENFRLQMFIEIDSDNPALSNTSSIFKFLQLEEDKIKLTSMKDSSKYEIWKRIDTANHKEMAKCWRIHKKQDEGDLDWRVIEYAPRKTIKMLTDNYYQVLAFNKKTGQFIGSSGGTWSKTKSNYFVGSNGGSNTKNSAKYIENIAFFSKNSTNVGRSLEFDLKISDGLWNHTGRQTDGKTLLEIWMPYK